jgi:hypothetical protein
MFEVPSTDLTEYVVTLDFARQQVENANMAVLKESTEDK